MRGTVYCSTDGVQPVVDWGTPTPVDVIDEVQRCPGGIKHPAHNVRVIVPPGTAIARPLLACRHRVRVITTAAGGTR